MKKLIQSAILILIVSQAIFAQDITTVEAKSYDISDNLDLEAVASIFGESKNLEDFENKLNDPELQISNLDLNGDGYVDYLRVVENSEAQTILITIQAVLGEDLFQDVATIDVEKDSNGKTYVQVVGDVYMYGPDYIIEPVYYNPPVVVLFFWGPNYCRWHSPYYWHHYPTHYHVWHPHPPHIYHNNIHVRVNMKHAYYYTTVRRSSRAVHINNTISRNDYARSHPNRSFTSRNAGVRNTHELNRQRGTAQKATNTTRPASTSRSNGSRVQSNRNGSSQSNSRSGQTNTARSSTRSTTATRQKQNKTTQSRGAQSRTSQTRSSQNKQTRSVGTSRQNSNRSGGKRSDNQGSGGSKSGSKENRKRR
ncbi:hypothetical protein ACFLSE_02610 [Bacteroidota bacterium]